MLGVEIIKEALAKIRPHTQGVDIGAEVRVGRDATDDEAVWVYVVVPDEQIDTFYQEWDQVREDIRRNVRESLEKPDMFVYVRMRAASEETSESPAAS